MARHQPPLSPLLPSWGKEASNHLPCRTSSLNVACMALLPTGDRRLQIALLTQTLPIGTPGRPAAAASESLLPLLSLGRQVDGCSVGDSGEQETTRTREGERRGCQARRKKKKSASRKCPTAEFCFSGRLRQRASTVTETPGRRGVESCQDRSKSNQKWKKRWARLRELLLLHEWKRARKSQDACRRTDASESNRRRGGERRG